ncbi:MAG: family 20 glycosylhydrolase [Betaproteobacteria bacterium]
MMKIALRLLCAVALATSTMAGALAAAAPSPRAPLALVPWPAEVAREGAGLRLASGAVIAVPAGDVPAGRIATALAARLLRDRGLRLTVRPGDTGAIVLRRTADGPSDAYRMEIAPTGVTLSASGDAGLFYAGVSLWQLCTADAARGAVALPGLRVADAPRFAWRGAMLDVARHFAPVADVEALLDEMALHKLNVLHLHLSDDQGWRFEIKRYPELTRIGAWRTPPGGRPARYGGFYTQAQIRGLIAYAAERHIDVVPEFDMPGHAQAAVAAYPQFGVDIDAAHRPAVSVDWGVNPYLFNVDDRSLRFLEDVLDEVVSVFPSTFIHVGGDEALKDQWKASPAVQQRMQALGLKSEEALQSWFIDHIGDYLASKGRRLIGWDEILEGGLPANASVMSWRGTEGALAAARMGHDVVLAPGGSLYLDGLQSGRDDEPEGRLGQLPIKRVYEFEPVAPELDAAQARHVMGLEGALWTEYVPSRQLAEHALFPRIAALAEVAWSPRAARHWDAFLPRLVLAQQRYRRQGIATADSAFAVQFDVVGGPAAALAAGKAQVRLSNQLAFGEIRYTLDGSMPNASSTALPASGQLELRLPAHLRANAFADDGTPLAAPRSQRIDPAHLLTRGSNALTACPGGELGLRMPLRPEATDWTPVFNVNLMDSCWIYPAARLDGVAAIVVDAARLARNYGLAHDAAKVVQHPAAAPDGELEVRLGDCAGALLASLPLPDGSATRTYTLRAPLPANTGVHDLCLRFTADIHGPLHAIDAVRLVPTPTAH